MLPCCIFGALLLAQLAAFSRWFRRAILRRPVAEPGPDVQPLWVPQPVTLRRLLGRIFPTPRARRIVLAAVLGEVGLFVTVWALGGLDFIGHLIAGHAH